MDLKTALARVAPAIGDGKIIAVHQYVALTGGTLVATDGRMTATAPTDWQGTAVCVRGDMLARVLERDNPRPEANGEDLVVRYAPRGRVTLRGIPVADYPLPSAPAADVPGVRLPEGFMDALKALQGFTGEDNGPVWTTCVHFAERHAFAVGNRAAARVEVGLGREGVVSLPPWAAAFIAAQPVAPEWLHSDGTQLRLIWPDGVVLYSTLAAEAPTAAALSLVAGLPDTEMPVVPPGLKEAVAHAKEHGSPHIEIGRGAARFTHDAMVFEEEIATDVEPRRWSLPYLAAALDFATQADLSQPNGFWRGTGMRGVFAGLTY